MIAEQVEADKGIDNLYKFHVNVDDPNQDISTEEMNTDSDEGAVG